MSNKYCNLVGSKLIKDDFQNINIGFDQVQSDMESKDTNINKRVDELEKNTNTSISELEKNTNTSINEIHEDINNLSFTGSSHDALVTSALVDSELENFGPSGQATYLDGRLSKWEKKQPRIAVDQPTDQPNGGIWYEELSSEDNPEEDLFILNMVVQDDAPSDPVVLWGDT